MLVVDCVNTLSSVFIKLNEDRKANRFCDVVIHTGAKSFPAHKIVLSASSAYFNAMFGGHFQETDQGEITLKGEDPEILESVLEYCYTRRLNTRHNSLLALIDAFDKFAVDSAIKLLDKNLSLIIDPENAVFYLEIAVQYNGFNDLKREASVAFLKKDDSSLTEYLLTAVPEILVELLKHEEFYSRRSTTSILIEWLYSPNAVPAMYDSVSFPHLLSDELQKVANCPLAKGAENCSTVLPKQSICHDYHFQIDDFDWVAVESLRLEMLPGAFSKKFQLGNDFVIQFYKNTDDTLPRQHVSGIKVWPEEDCRVLGTYNVEILMTESPLNKNGTNYRFTGRWCFSVSNSHPYVVYFDFDDTLKYKVRMAMSRV